MQLIIENILLRGGGGGGRSQGQKFWEDDFEITYGPKGPQRGPTVWPTFEPKT